MNFDTWFAKQIDYNWFWSMMPQRLSHHAKEFAKLAFEAGQASELLGTAIAFKMWGIPNYHSYDITVEKRSDKDGGRWGVYQGDRCCWDNRYKWFLFESLPSSRTDEDLASTRFSLDEAMVIAKEIASTFRISYETWASEPVEKRSRYWIPPQPPEEMTEIPNSRQELDITNLVSAGDMTGALRLVREITGLGLAEAQAYIERLSQ